MTDARANRAEFFKPERRIHQVRRDHPNDRTTDDDALQSAAATQATAKFFDDVAHGDAKLDLVKTGPIEQ